MWGANVTYDDANNFLSDKTLLTGAVQSVISYLNTFIQGSGTINVQIQVSQTPTGRFGGTGAVVASYSENGLTYVAPEVMKELAAGANLNGSDPDLIISVDPTTSYFKGLSFDTSPYTAPRTVPAGTTDGQTVLLHEIMHGLGLASARYSISGDYPGIWRNLWDTFSQPSGTLQTLNVPDFASHGLAPILVTNDSPTQNWSHLGDLGVRNEGYVDDIMNGLAFYTGQRYFMSQIDLMILDGLGYKVTIPDNLPLSYYGFGSKGLVKPAVSADPASVTSAMTGNTLHLSGTAAAGAMTSVLEHNTLLATTTADASGHWALDVTTDPSLTASALVVRDGTHAIDSDAISLARDTTVGSHLIGSALYNKLTGGDHNDVFTAGPRGAAMDGKAGLDTVIYNEARAANTITAQDGGFTVKDASGTDTLTGIERLHFSDGMVALDVGSDGIAGQAYRLYQAAFDRTPDPGGLGYWISAMDNGASLSSVAHSFVHSSEFQALYGVNPNNSDVLTRYYENVLHRDADPAGFQYWLNILDKHLASQADVLMNFSQSTENQAALVGTMANGISYTAFT